jgi:hypothetical protein
MTHRVLALFLATLAVACATVRESAHAVDE